MIDEFLNLSLSFIKVVLVGLNSETFAFSQSLALTVLGVNPSLAKDSFILLIRYAIVYLSHKPMSFSVMTLNIHPCSLQNKSAALHFSWFTAYVAASIRYRLVLRF